MLDHELGIPLFLAASLAFLVFFLFMAICDPNKEERELKEKQQQEQLLKENEKQEWLKQNCQIKKESDAGFVTRVVYKCNDGSKRVMYR